MCTSFRSEEGSGGMLAAATVLMSCGTLPANARPASPGQGGSADTSFAESFDEGTALAGMVQTQFADDIILLDPHHLKTDIPLKGVDASTPVSANTKNEDALQNGLNTAKDLVSITIAKAHTEVGGVKMMSAASEARLSNSQLDENTSTTVQAKVPEDQSAAGDLKDGVPKLLPGQVESPELKGTEDSADSQTDIAVSEIPINPDTNARPVITDQKQATIPEKLPDNPGTDLTKKLAKIDDGATKVEEDGKSKAKEEIDKSAVKVDDADGSVVPIIVTVPVIVPAENAQSRKMVSSQNNTDSPSAASVNTGRSVGLAVTKDNRANNKNAEQEKPDRSGMKLPVPALVVDSVQKKSRIDEAKIAVPAITAEDKAKAQSATTATPGVAAIHVDAGAVGLVSGPTAVIPAAHTEAARIVTEINSHTAGLASGIGTQAGLGGTGNPAGAFDAAHRTLTATPTALEVGISNGTHGWLKIRAEMTSSGQVNASLSTASTSGQEVLYRELPSLTAYLHNERVAVNTVIVQPAVAIMTDFRGFTGGMTGDGRGQAEHNGSQGGENRQSANALMHRSERHLSYNGLNGTSGDELLPAISYARGGSWLSVRA
jgi:hypothetical protein